MVDKIEQGTAAGYFSSEQNAEAALRALHFAGFSAQQIGLAGHLETIHARQPETGFWRRTRAIFGGGAPTPPNASATGTAAEQPAANTAPEESGYYPLDASDFHRTLSGLSLPDEQARYFRDRLSREQGGILITVNAGQLKGDAEKILRLNGADVGKDIALKHNLERSDIEPETRAADLQTSAAAAPSPLPKAEKEPEEARRIQLYGETLRVHRERIGRGEVRLHKETVTEQRNVNVPVSREELVIERRPVDERPAPGARIGENKEIRIPLQEEHVSVEKEPVVREEVVAGKREVTKVEPHQEELRREELKIEGEQPEEIDKSEIDKSKKAA